ncbi:hypothetical protein OPIT5_00340 (plasmid) [Opitutaceae bacterium TAV5]|nr:hypothetical protein OPIT5_00340 [Opitutaceae bacterium TAV5]
MTIETFVETRSSTFKETAKELFALASIKLVDTPLLAGMILHQLELPGWCRGKVNRRKQETDVEVVAARLIDDIERTRSRYRDRDVYFCLPVKEKDFVRILSVRTVDLGDVSISSNIADSITRMLQEKQKATAPAAVNEGRFALDALEGMSAEDLRDRKNGRLDANKVGELFGLTNSELATACGMSKQGLGKNPTSLHAQGLLEHFERIARLRKIKQFEKDGALRIWFRKRLPLFGNESAEAYFRAGKIDEVAEKVDQFLTGDFSG